MHYFTMEVSFYYLLLNRRQYFSSVFFFVLALATLLGEMQALKELQGEQKKYYSYETLQCIQTSGT